MDDQSRPKWKRLGKLLGERRGRIDARYVNRRVFAEDVSVTAGVLRDIENAARDNYKPPTLAAIEQAYRWAPGSIERVLAGGDPAELPAQAERDYAPAAAAAPSRWFLGELRRRKVSLTDITSAVNVLRQIADHNAQTLAELLLEAGLVLDEELEIRDHPDSTREEIARFQRDVEGITSSPHLSSRQRRQIEDRAAAELERIREESGGDA